MRDKKKMQKKKSVCEQSMQMMINIIKFSSFSLATTINLGDRHTHSSRLNIPTKPFSTDYSSNPNLSKSKKSKLQPLTKSYLMEQGAGDHDDRSRSSPNYMVYRRSTANDDDDDGNFSDYIRRFHKGNHNEVNRAITNEKATDYIRKFHEKNSRDYTLASSTGVPMVLPPPPNYLNT